MPRCSLLLCKDNANREQNRQTTFECYAEMQLILCKDNANHWFNKINTMFFENMSKVNIRSHASHLYATDKNIRWIRFHIPAIYTWITLKPQSVIKIRSGFLFYIEQIFVKFFTSTFMTGYAEVKGVQAVRIKCQRSACDKKQQDFWSLQVVQCRDAPRCVHISSNIPFYRKPL